MVILIFKNCFKFIYLLRNGDEFFKNGQINEDRTKHLNFFSISKILVLHYLKYLTGSFFK